MTALHLASTRTLPSRAGVAIALAWRLAVIGLLVLVATGCAAGRSTSATRATPVSPTATIDTIPPSAGAPARALTVAKAAGYRGDEPVLVRGALFVTDRETRLCDVIAESYPPQCGGASLRVHGLDLDTVTGEHHSAGSDAAAVTWVEQATVLGRVTSGDTLVVSRTAI